LRRLNSIFLKSSHRVEVIARSHRPKSSQDTSVAEHDVATHDYKHTKTTMNDCKTSFLRCALLHCLALIKGALVSTLPMHCTTHQRYYFCQLSNKCRQSIYQTVRQTDSGCLCRVLSVRPWCHCPGMLHAWGAILQTLITISTNDTICTKFICLGPTRPLAPIVHQYTNTGPGSVSKVILKQIFSNTQT